MAIFLPFAASATPTSLGAIAQWVAESNSVVSLSLPSGSLSPTLMVMRRLRARGWIEAADDNSCRLQRRAPAALHVDAREEDEAGDEVDPHREDAQAVVALEDPRDRAVGER